MNSIDWGTTTKLIPTLAPAASAFLGLLKSDASRRTAIREEAELLEKLPPNSAARETLLALLETEITELADRRNWKRDWAMAIVSLVCAPSLGLLSLWLSQRGSWWGWALAAPAALLAIVFLYGIFDSVQLRPRKQENSDDRDGTH